MPSQRLIAYAFAAGLVSLMAGSAMADDEGGNFNAFLKGKYRHSASISCVTGQTSDDIGSGPPIHISFAGVTTYEGNDQATAREHGIVIGPGQPGTFEEECSSTYEVNRNGSFSRKSICKATDGSYTLSGIKWKGQISDEGSVLSMNQVERVEQTLVGDGFSVKRICGGMGTEVRIQRP